MSGRPKRAPATPEEEREQLRQLTRELHEGAQEARDAASRLNVAAAVAAVGPDLEKRAEIACQELLLKITDMAERCIETLTRFEKRVDDSTAGAIEDIEANHASLCGFKTPEELGQYIGKQSASSLAMNSDFIGLIIDGVYAMIMKKLPGGAREAGGLRVNVGTAENVAAFIAAGGDPGIVFHLRGSRP